MVTQNELRFAANVPDAYVLALVEVSARTDRSTTRSATSTRPYGADVRLPFDTTSTTLAWHAYWQRATPTTGRLMPTKLIEVALPLDVINREAAREKSIRHGHPSTLHLWWARRPLAACRAVLFAQLVDDPSAHPELFPTEARSRTRARAAVRHHRAAGAVGERQTTRRSSKRHERRSGVGIPTACRRSLDPFCGGGSIPLEAQRLGLEAMRATSTRSPC